MLLCGVGTILTICALVALGKDLGPISVTSYVRLGGAPTFFPLLVCVLLLPLLYLWGGIGSMDGRFPSLVVMIGFAVNLIALYFNVASPQWRRHRFLTVYFLLCTLGFALSFVYPDLAMHKVKIG